MARPSIKRNYIYNLSFQIINLLAPLLIQPYITRVLGANGIGEYSFAFSNVSYFVFFATLGTSSYAQREIASCGDERYKYTPIFWEVFILRSIDTFIAIILYLLLILQTGMNTITLLMCLNILNVAFDITWFFQGIEEFQKTATRSIAIKLFFVIFTLLMVKKPDDLWIYTLGYCAIQILANISLWIFVPRYIGKCKIEFTNLKRHIVPSFMLFLPTIATQVYTVLDKTMIGIFTVTNIQNGLYEQAEKISRIALTVYQSYGAVVAPRISNLYARGDDKGIESILTSSIRFMWMLLSPMMLGMIAISNNQIPWFYGSEFIESIPILRVFSLLLIPVGLSTVLAVEYLVPIKKQNLFTLSVTVGAISNIIMNLILIPRFYAVGAAIASVLAETIITAVQIYIVHRIKGPFSIKKLISPGIKYLVFSIVMFVPVFSLGEIMKSNVINTFLLCLAGLLIYGTLLIISKDSMVISLLRKVYHRKS